jgi:hypothetical protein
MRKALSGIALAILSFAFIVLTAGSSTAAVVATPFAELQIGTIGYNAVGTDTYANRNKEFVDVKAVAAFDVKDLVVSDSWGRVNNPDGVGCNAYKIVNNLPGKADTVLPAGHTLRVYVGAGTPSFDDVRDRYNVFMNSNDDCGSHGQFFDNLGDRAFIAKGTQVESRHYGFENGYYV